MEKQVGSSLDELKKNLKIDLIAILLAAKDGYSEKELNKQYQFINGRSIPYSLLGYSSLFNLMNDKFMRDSVRIQKRELTLIYFGVHNDATTSLGNLVTHQIDSEKKYRELSRQREKIRIIKSANQVVPTSYEHGIYLKLQRETIENLKNVIELYCQEPVRLSSIITLYKEHTEKNLDLTKLGFSDIAKFLDEKLGKSVKFLVGEDECMVISKNSKSKYIELLDSDAETIEEPAVFINPEKKFSTLREEVSYTLGNHLNINVPLANFYKLFSNKYGYSFDHREYGLGTIDQLFDRLISVGDIEVTFDSENQKLIKLLPEKRRTSKPRIFFPESMDSDSEIQKVRKEPKEALEKQKEARMKQFILEYGDLDATKVKKQLLRKQKASIMVSNIIDPSNFQIQLEENRKDLEELMAELENIYCGFGASYYDMTVEDLIENRLCAATFFKDKNWHRCKIEHYDQALKKTQVFYIDYGGYDFVELKDIKFLDKKFVKWPILILDAKFHNIKRPSNVDWKDNIIKYLLTKVQGVFLTVKIMGSLKKENLEFFSLEILHKTKNQKASNQKVKNFTLNNQLIKDGHGEFFDEKLLDTYVDCETLCKNYHIEENDVSATYNTLLSASNSYDDIASNSNTNSLSFSNASVYLDSNKQIQDRIERNFSRLCLKNKHMVEKIEFFDRRLKVFLFKIDNITYIDCSHAAAILKLSVENFFNLCSSISLEQINFFKTFTKKDLENSSIFELYYEIFKESPSTIKLFAFDKLEILMDLELSKLKDNMNLRQPIEEEEYWEDLTYVEDVAKYNEEILHEMKRNYKIYLEEFENSKKQPLSPFENAKFKSDYRSFILDEIHFILGQMEILDKRIRDELITAANKRWLECRRKFLGKKFDCLYHFIEKLK